MPFYTPLRYPGGKRKLAPFLEALIHHNNLDACTYVEPYAGGAGLALHLLFSGVARKILINDVDPHIHYFWISVLEYTDELCRLISDTPVTMDVWYRQQEIRKDVVNASAVELGFSTLFLNRTNRSGILKGGVIGGKRQDGAWKMDVRFKKDDIIKRIQKIADQKNRITVFRNDAVVFLNRIEPMLSPSDSLVYLDPPYYEKGSALYENYYKSEDHRNVADRVATLNLPWLVSYDNVEPIQCLYSSYPAITYSLNYTAQAKMLGSEFMAFSPRLQLPDSVYTGTQCFPLLRDITLLRSA